MHIKTKETKKVIIYGKTLHNLPYPSRNASSKNFEGSTLAPSHTNPWNSWLGSTLYQVKQSHVKNVEAKKIY